MQGYINSAVVGGRAGYIFNDIFAMGHDGNFLVDDYNKNTLDKVHPIQRITISSGWVVDGISVTYQLDNGNNVTLHHGSQWKNPTAEIRFGPNEILVGVFGRAGMQRFYKREMVNQIGFVICDLGTCEIRKVGPYGNANNSNDGTVFYTSDVLAFGGFAEHTDHLGLSGLFFFKDLNRPQTIPPRTQGAGALALSIADAPAAEDEEAAVAKAVEGDGEAAAPNGDAA
ncbi:hypothetical protein C8Q76DRAFT_67615 [Earliella scabrosa]|nr:hypothetical protein C8Q76DRAFT_67615 [Earliella scabrosa]